MTEFPHRLDRTFLMRAFEKFESTDLEVLKVFASTADKVRQGRFHRLGHDIGSAPSVEIVRRATSGREGQGVIRTLVANPEVREAVFPAVRKLRTESNACSTSAVRNILHRRSSRALRTAPENVPAQLMSDWLRDLKARIRHASNAPALVSSSIRNESEARNYATRATLLNLAQNGDVFHDDLHLRQDLDLLMPIVEPAIDEALMAVVEVALDLAHVVERVLADPAMMLR